MATPRAAGNLAADTRTLAETADTLAVNSAVSWEWSIKQRLRHHPLEATGARASPKATVRS